MIIHELTAILAQSEDVTRFWRKLDAGEDAAMGVAASARPLFIASRFSRSPRTTLVVCPGEEAAAAIVRHLRAYLGDGEVLHFPLRHDAPLIAAAPTPKAIAARARAAFSLAAGEPRIVVASAEALMRRIPPASAGVYEPLVLWPELDLSQAGLNGLSTYDDLPSRLLDLGYELSDRPDRPGTFNVHNGLVDVYPGNLTFPVRIDAFGDEIDEIRRLVPGTGQTISSLRKVEIYPVRENYPSIRAYERALASLELPARTNGVLRARMEEAQAGPNCPAAQSLMAGIWKNTVTLGEYVPDFGEVALIEPRAIFDEVARAFDEAKTRLSGTGLEVTRLFAGNDALSFGKGTRATYVSLMRAGVTLDAEIPIKRTEVAGGPERLAARLKGFEHLGYTIVFSIPQYRPRQSMKLDLVDNHFPIVDWTESGAGSLSANPSETMGLLPGVVNIVDIDIPLGLVIPKAGLALVSLSDTVGGSSMGRRRVDVTEVTFPFKPGDYVVHAYHGVALFSDLVKRELDGQERMYLLLEYAEGDKLYVPVEQLDRVTRYVGPEGASPRLTRLNTADWSRALNRARKVAKALAFDLVDVYSRRAAAQGFRFSSDNRVQQEMEDAFPYEETPDQLSAIAEVKADMMSARPMDRLVCGDVGFGKTEVALRAAFKATQDGKQVMVLCPTTILAQQHFTTFRDRCEPFGTRVAVLSRFVSDAEQKRVLEGFRDGSVDILVGTHRLLSRDVNPHDLGLVVIDEEQRFGVGHKEQFKNLRESVDVLTLSATPIPRTLQMSLSGVRDMSLILTPPDERRAVEVYVGEWDPDLVSDAIRRELERHGQVYYVSNRVRTIDDALARVLEAAPEARVGVAHGKMSKDALERVMEDFSAGQLDVLLATTIIESGIDNPHTNTLIIEDSQRLGLAQMYQLKGRVGRSARQAYAYFMFPGDSALTEEAAARLSAIDEHRELGSGMQIALRDLEIRGAGDLLGAEQSGNMSAVGFDLYAQMIASAVEALRDGRPGDEDTRRFLSDIVVNLPGSAYLGEEYIPDADVRVLWYRRLAFAARVEEVEALRTELVSKAGEMPPEAAELFDRARLKALCAEQGIESITVANARVTVEPVTLTPEKATALRRGGGRWMKEQRRLILTVRFLGKDAAGHLATALFEYLS